MSKTHYRKVFKSDHLGVADLEEMIEEGRVNLIFTIKEVKQEVGVTVAGRKGDHNIAYFKENIKPLVLNATNSKRVRSFNNGSVWVEDWSDTLIELYCDYEVKMKGEKVGGVRIKTKQPTTSKPKKQPINNVRLKTAITSINSGEYTIEKLKAKFDLTEDQEIELNNALENG